MKSKQLTITLPQFILIIVAMIFVMLVDVFGPVYAKPSAQNLRALHAELGRVLKELESKPKCKCPERRPTRGQIPYPIHLCGGWEHFSTSCRAEEITVGLWCEPINGKRSEVCTGHILRQWKAWKKTEEPWW